MDERVAYVRRERIRNPVWRDRRRMKTCHCAGHGRYQDAAAPRVRAGPRLARRAGGPRGAGGRAPGDSWRRVCLVTRET